MQFRWRDNNYHDRIERRKIATTHESRNPNDRARRKRSWLRFCHFSRIQSVSPERCLLVLDVRERQDTAKELATAHDTPEARESEQKRSHTTVNVDPNRIYIYIPIQHRSINRANTDKREIFHWSFADFTFPEENLCRYRKWRQLSRGSPPLFKLFPATVRLEPNFTPLQRYTNDIYIFLSKIIWSWPSDYSSHVFTWETWTFHSMGQLYNIQRRVICLAGMRLATLLESAAFPRGWRRSDRLRWDERVPWFLEGRVSNE